jgi:hypothetical protein
MDDCWMDDWMIVGWIGYSAMVVQWSLCLALCAFCESPLKHVESTQKMVNGLPDHSQDSAARLTAGSLGEAASGQREHAKVCCLWLPAESRKLEAAESRKLVVVSETFLVSSRQLKRRLMDLRH